MQTDHRGDGVDGSGGLNDSATVEDQAGFFRQHETKRALKTTHVDGFEICVQHQDRFIHIIMINYSASLKKGILEEKCA